MKHARSSRACGSATCLSGVVVTLPTMNQRICRYPKNIRGMRIHASTLDTCIHDFDFRRDTFCRSVNKTGLWHIQCTSYTTAAPGIYMHSGIPRLVSYSRGYVLVLGPFQDPIMRDLGACNQQIFINKVCWRSWLYQGIGLDVVRSSKANLYNV